MQYTKAILAIVDGKREYLPITGDRMGDRFLRPAGAKHISIPLPLEFEDVAVQVGSAEKERLIKTRNERMAKRQVYHNDRRVAAQKGRENRKDSEVNGRN